MTVRILIGDCRVRMAELPDASVDSVVCDPPYHLTTGKKGGTGVASVNLDSPYGRSRIGTGNGAGGFMGMKWDGGDVAFQMGTWAEVLRVLKPGGHLIAFSGTRTYHRMVCAIEDAGFEIRDQLAWVYGSGFPKSLDVSKQIDKAAGAEREVVGRAVGMGKQNPQWNGTAQGRAENSFKSEYDATAPATDAAREWQGWGTALKPSWEPICLARKPLIGTVAANVLAHGTGALNIDGCRIEAQGRPLREVAPMRDGIEYRGNALEGRVDGSLQSSKAVGETDLGRWPANLCHDGSEEVLAGFPETGESVGGSVRKGIGVLKHGGENARPQHSDEGGETIRPGYVDSGSAARFFYCAKATTDERGEGNTHPTVKPIALMRWLVRLVTPKGGTVLDPFMGSGSTLIAADVEQFHAIGCELSSEYAAIAEKRIREAAGMFADVTVAQPPKAEAA